MYDGYVRVQPLCLKLCPYLLFLNNYQWPAIVETQNNTSWTSLAKFFCVSGYSVKVGTR